MVAAVVLQDPLHLPIEMVQLVLPTKDMVVEMVIMDHHQPLVLVVAVLVSRYLGALPSKFGSDRT